MPQVRPVRGGRGGGREGERGRVRVQGERTRVVDPFYKRQQDMLRAGIKPQPVATQWPTGTMPQPVTGGYAPVPSIGPVQPPAGGPMPWGGGMNYPGGGRGFYDPANQARLMGPAGTCPTCGRPM
jgi:hypothetical protein